MSYLADYENKEVKVNTPKDIVFTSDLLYAKPLYGINDFASKWTTTSAGPSMISTIQWEPKEVYVVNYYGDNKCVCVSFEAATKYVAKELDIDESDITFAPDPGNKNIDMVYDGAIYTDWDIIKYKILREEDI